MAPYRVVQWTTGNVGERSVRAIATRPDLELVGCYAWSSDKVGRDAGELAGIEPLGVVATNDVDALLALKPDCVAYNPMWSNTDELVRILSAGVNVVSTAAFITGGQSPEDRELIAKACEAGGSSMFGTGISPGFIEMIAAPHTGGMLAQASVAPTCTAPPPSGSTAVNRSAPPTASARLFR